MPSVDIPGQKNGGLKINMTHLHVYTKMLSHLLGHILRQQDMTNISSCCRHVAACILKVLKPKNE